MLSITPSLPAQSFEELNALISMLAESIPMFQVDIVDGEFVPLRSWPFTEGNKIRKELTRLKKFIEIVPLEIDCMAMHVEQYLDIFAEIEIKSLIVHMGSTDAYTEIITHSRVYDYKIGLAITNDNKISELKAYIDTIDFVQVMGIAKVGKQGQPFDKRTLTTVRKLRKLYPQLPIVVDGAVNKDTLIPLKNAGVTRFAPGSAISKAHDPIHAYKQLCVLLEA